jgi:hypothetical protein
MHKKHRLAFARPSVGLEFMPHHFLPPIRSLLQKGFLDRQYFAFPYFAE